MKNFLLCMVLAGLMMPVVAQEKLFFSEKKSRSELKADLGLPTVGHLPFIPAESLVEIGSWTSTLGTTDTYDRQTQGSVYPMSRVHKDGFIGLTWTNEDNLPGEGSTPFRGVAYTYSTDGGKTWSEVDKRVGGIPVYWASYTQWGANGEAILARSADSYEHGDIQILNGLVLMSRENKGVGEWTLRVVPYPAGTPVEDGWVMAWSRMASSGDNNQYLHIFTHTRWGASGGKYYEGYETPVFYYRTQDAGATWDIEGKLVPDQISSMVWDKTPEDPVFTDDISIATYGDVVAVVFIRLGFHAYMMKSTDNGDNWEATEFFHASVRYDTNTAAFADTSYMPTLGSVAVDHNGKVHIAFGNRLSYNDDGDSFWILSGPFTSFLSYWNEDMPTLDGYDYLENDMYDLMFDVFVDENLSVSNEKLYIKSTTPQWPIVGFYTPNAEDNYFKIPVLDDYKWIQESYAGAGSFSFPQMAFDAYNTMHLVYLGMLNDGADDFRWHRHPYYTTRDEDGTWTETEYLVNTIDLVDREFAYLISAGVQDDKMHLTTQVDPYAGVSTAYVNPGPPDHSPTISTYYYNYVQLPVSINEVDYTPLTMTVFPNPTSGQATVKFEGKGNITVYNMLGQTVYHVENVEGFKKIPLNMATGVYFVTVRSDNATATQKLIVK